MELLSAERIALEQRLSSDKIELSRLTRKRIFKEMEQVQKITAATELIQVRISIFKSMLTVSLMKSSLLFL